MEKTPPKAADFTLEEALDNCSLTETHWRIWFLSAAGVMLDGFDLFIIGICMPLLVRYFGALPWQAGLIGAAAIVGAVFGASILGPVTDKHGRKALFLFNMAVLIAFGVLCGFSWSIWSLVVFRFLVGIGVGADYPICSAYISEFMPKRIRGRMLISAFSLQAMGMLLAAGLGLLVLKIYPSEEAWRWMLALGSVPAAFVFFFRTTVPESARWLVAQGRIKEAADVVQKILPEKRSEIRQLLVRQEAKEIEERKTQLSYGSLFHKKYIRRTVLAAVPWFLMDISTYGVGLFTPIILAALALPNPTGSYVAQVFYITEEVALLDVFLIVGFLLNIWLVEKWGRITLQMVGFIGMALGLAILAISASLPGGSHIALVFGGFIIFNVLMNMGPNPTTFALAAEIFPTEIRASGEGFAAAWAKVGAAIGIFFLPILKASWGVTWTLITISCTALLGMIITAIFRIETKGKSLEQIQGIE